MEGSIRRVAKGFGIASSASSAVLALAKMPVVSVAIVCACALTGFAMYLLTQCWLAREERRKAVELARLTRRGK
jgi:hypothetical protein